MSKINKKILVSVLFIFIILAFISIFVFRHIYYKDFELKEYLHSNYGLDIEFTNQYDELTGALFVSSPEKIYECYDKDNNIEFEVCFVNMENGNNELKYDTYEAASRIKVFREQLSAAVSVFTEDYIAVVNGESNICGDIFINIDKPDDIKAISAELDTIIMDYQSKYNTYVKYNLIIIKDKELFGAFEQAEETGRLKVDTPYSIMTYSEYMIPNITFCITERITSTDIIDDNALYEIFENNGDINDEEYRDSYKYKYIVFYCSSEPDALLSKEFKIKVLGLMDL